MEYNNDFKYDLKVGQVAEKLLAEILENKKIEVKKDLKAIKTGNIFVEYFSWGKASGISTSEADFYCFFITDGRMFLIETKELKQLCRVYLGTNRDKLGGDSNTSKGILLPLKDLIK
tara:strand:+ start:581 stop:931 length:351 start_codon:yes stop_codon:yes gene_type:complete